MPFLLPYARIELLIRTMLTRTWAPGVAGGEARTCEGAQAAPAHCTGRVVELNSRGPLLRTALGFLALEPREPELRRHDARPPAVTDSGSQRRLT